MKQMILLLLLLKPTVTLSATKTLLQQLFDAIENNKHKKVDNILKSNTINLNKKRNDGLAPIHVAGNPIILQKLLFYNVNQNLPTSCTNFTLHPLFGNHETLLHLLMIEAHSIMSTRNYSNATKLYKQLHNVINLVLVLLNDKNTDINPIDDKYRTPLDIILSIEIGTDQSEWKEKNKITNISCCLTLLHYRKIIISILESQGCKAIPRLRISHLCYFIIQSI